MRILRALAAVLVLLGCATEERGRAAAGGSATGGQAARGARGGEPGPGDGGATPAGPSSDDPPERWVGTWAASPQLTEPRNAPPDPPGLEDATLRQFAYVSLGGTELRLQLSNEFGDGPVTLRAVHVARPTSGSAIDAATDVALRFSGSSSVTIPAGRAVYSDAFDFDLAPQSMVAVSMRFGGVPGGVTGHPGSRTTSYLVSGDAVAAATLVGATPTDHWYYLTRIEVKAPASAGAVVILGDSLTDGRGSTTNGNDRWPDALSRRLRAHPATAGVAVLNAGMGGNAVVEGGLGPPARSRFARDVLGQAGVRWVIVLHGVNDVGASRRSVARDLIAAYQELIAAAHAAGVHIYGAPLLPFGGSSYYDAAHEQDRRAVNQWIRECSGFDAVLDLDAVVADPAHPTRLLAAHESGARDHLHLGPAGYQAMADAIDLSLFVDPFPRTE